MVDQNSQASGTDKATLTLQPDTPEALANRGLVYSRGQVDLAFRIWKAIRLEPDYAEPI